MFNPAMYAIILCHVAEIGMCGYTEIEYSMFGVLIYFLLDPLNVILNKPTFTIFTNTL